MFSFSSPSVSLTDEPHASALQGVSTAYAQSIHRLCTRSALALIQRTIRGLLFPCQWGVTYWALSARVGWVTRVESVAAVACADEDLDLLDRVLQDRKVSTAERRALDGLIAALGLGADDVARLNRHYMRGVVDAV